MDSLDTDYSFLFESPSKQARPASKLKPNTRFLQHIVREANSHNAALLAKETAEARARLRQLSRRGRAGDGSSDDDTSRRHDGRSQKRRDDSTRSSKRRQKIAEDDDCTRHRRRHHDDERDPDDKKVDREGDERRRRPSRKNDDGKEEEEEYRRYHRSSRQHHSRNSHRSRRGSRSRSRSPGDTDVDEERRQDQHDRHDRHDRNGTTERRKRSRRSRSPKDRDGGQDRKRRHRERSPLSASQNYHSNGASSHRQGRDKDLFDSARVAQDSDSDSDPLSEFVGPLPASDSRSAASTVRIRGRGAIAGASSMDRHFSADYDPSEDVELPESAASGRPTVDDARAEMQRDRQKLLREGAARLKAAGFTDREIAIWTRGGKRDVADIQWTKKGEAREWDRGKVIGDNGPAKPEWAR